MWLLLRHDVLLWYYYNANGHQYYQNSKSEQWIWFQDEFGILRYAHYFKTGRLRHLPISLCLSAINPLPLRRRGTETALAAGDVILNAGIFLVNNPASKTYLALTEYVTCQAAILPWEGVKYGTNRYSYRRRLDLLKLRPGFFLDLAAAASSLRKTPTLTLPAQAPRSASIFI